MGEERKGAGIISGHQHSVPAQAEWLHWKVWGILHPSRLTETSSPSTGRRNWAMAVESGSGGCCCCHYDIIGQTLETVVVVQEDRATGTLGESCDLFKPQFSLR